MRIVTISDTHTKHGQLTQPASLLTIPEGDVLIHAGDFTAMGRTGETVKFLKWFAALPHPHKVLVAGNHDFMCLNDPEQFARLLAQHAPDVHYLNEARNSVVIEGARFTGTPSTPLFGNWAFMRSPEELDRIYRQFPEDTDVLITHGPPRGIGDSCYPDGEQAGCPLLAMWVYEHQPAFHVYGHIHEGYGIRHAPYIRTTFVNTSVCDRQYRVANAPHVFEFNKEPVCPTGTRTT